MNADKSFVVEYNKSKRCLCQGCGKSIGLQNLRLGAVDKSFDGFQKQITWYHTKCFFTYEYVEYIGDFELIEYIRLKHQKQIAEKLKASHVEYSVGYALSNKSVCVTCKQKLEKGELRIQKDPCQPIHQNSIKRHKTCFRHLNCFVQQRSQLKFYVGGQLLHGFRRIARERQNEIRALLPSTEMETTFPMVKRYKDLGRLKRQNKRFFYYLDYALMHMARNEVISLLRLNLQLPYFRTKMKLYEQLADMLAFGALENCPRCKRAKWLYTRRGFVCHNKTLAGTACSTVLRRPKRRSCQFPPVFRAIPEFMDALPKRPEHRLLPILPATQVETRKRLYRKELW